MTDKRLKTILDMLIAELHKRYGTKMCKKLDFGCPDCKTRVLIAHLNDQLELINWCIENKDK